jgi:DNA anti-recombination protein RmuC
VDRAAVNQIAEESADLKRRLNNMEQPMSKAKSDLEQVGPKVAEAQHELVSMERILNSSETLPRNASTPTSRTSGRRRKSATLLI